MDSLKSSISCYFSYSLKCSTVCCCCCCCCCCCVVVFSGSSLNHHEVPLWLLITGNKLHLSIIWALYSLPGLSSFSGKVCCASIMQQCFVPLYNSSSLLCFYLKEVFHLPNWFLMMGSLGKCSNVPPLTNVSNSRVLGQGTPTWSYNVTGND